MIRKTGAVVDVMRVPMTGDPSRAVLAVDHEAPSRTFDCDVLIVGGGLGGVAAALAATRRARNVCLLEETDWLGGQITSQGVSALDEHEQIETFGGTRSYYALREAIRDHYRALAADAREPLNPGNCWVSRLAFEPIVAVRTIDKLLAPAIEAGRLRVFLRVKAVAVEMDHVRIAGLRAMNLNDGTGLSFSFRYVLDATELGDLLPLSGAEHVVGAESARETGEPHAQPGHAKAHCVQSCTYVFAMDRHKAGQRHVIPKPERYAHYRDTQPYSLRIHVHGGEIYGETSGWLQYQVLEDSPGTKGPLWKYRRLVEAAQFPGHFPCDITMFNWPGNDYRDAPLVEQPPDALARALQDAKRVSLGFAHWLQTEAPDPSGGTGFPELALRPDVMGSADGLAKHPYIREGRRIKALRTIREQDVAIADQPGPRAGHFDDSVGLGWYPIDIHQAGEGEVGTSTRTRPFQIPLGALIPVRFENLIAANKNIGTTHITNGCYRLHPIEWNIGEAAGMLAALALRFDCAPGTIREDRSRLRAFQRELLSDGMPLAWLTDVPVSDAAFVAIQKLVMAGGFAGAESDLGFRPHAPIEPGDRARWMERLCGDARLGRAQAQALSRRAFALAMDEAGLT